MAVNQANIERAIRMILGLIVLSLVFSGPRTSWGYLGLIAIYTKASSMCPRRDHMTKIYFTIVVLASALGWSGPNAAEQMKEQVSGPAWKARMPSMLADVLVCR